MPDIAELPQSVGWYDEKWAIAIGGLVLAAAAATVYKAVAAGLEGLLFGRGKRIAQLEAAMSKQATDTTALRVAEHDLRVTVQQLDKRVSDHDEQLKRGELMMAKIELHLEETARATLRMETMLSELRQDVTQHLLQHGKQ